MRSPTDLGSKSRFLGGRLQREVLDAHPAKLAVVLLLVATHGAPAKRTGSDRMQVGRSRLHGKASGEPNDLKLSGGPGESKRGIHELAPAPGASAAAPC